jgi:hypothetical protein
MEFNAQQIAKEIYNKLSHDEKKINNILNYLGVDTTDIGEAFSYDAKASVDFLLKNYDMDRKQANSWVNKALLKVGFKSDQEKILKYITSNLRESVLFEQDKISDNNLRTLLLHLSKKAFETGAAKIAAKDELSDISSSNQNSRQSSTDSFRDKHVNPQSKNINSDEIYRFLKNMGIDQSEVDYLKKNIRRSSNLETWLKNHKNPETQTLLAAIGATYLRNR